MMMKKIFLTAVALATLLLAGCSEDELTPQVDTTSAYEKYIVENATRTPADSLIYEWFKQYNTAFVYHIDDKDIRWLWSSKFSLIYTPFDPEREKDMEMLLKHLKLIKQSFLDKYEEGFLRQNLPYKIFLLKDLQTAQTSLKYNYVAAATNNQDAMIIAYLQSTGRAYSAPVLESELSNLFGAFFYQRLPVKPMKFINSRVRVKYTLVTVPEDPAIEEELKIKPDFENEDHEANVCGFVKGYLPTHVQAPGEQQDFTDFLWFITQNRGSWIRQRTQFYKRLAQRGRYFIDFYREQLNQDLIELQNKKFPNDRVTYEDFIPQ